MKPASFLFLSIVLLNLPTASGADVSYFGVVKAAQYEQTNSSAPSLLITNGFRFEAFVVGASNNVVTNATLKLSNSSTVHQLIPETSGLAWLYEDLFNSQSELDDAYPAGSVFSPVNYTLTMSGTNDGVRSASLTFFILIIPVSYPATPEVTNLPAAQAIDTTRAFEVGWKPLGGGSTTILQLTVVDVSSNLVYSTPVPFEPGALNGASTSTVIPAYSLPPGANLFGHLTVANPGLPNTNSYPGAVGVPALAKDTQFPIVTRPAPARPLLEIRPAEASKFTLRLTGEANRLYTIQATEDFVTWTNLFTTNSSDFTYSDPDSTSLRARFYRARIGE